MPHTNKEEGNRTFYEKIDLDSFQGFAEQIGIAKGIDIDTIYPEIKEANSIVELGSGYGRVLHKLRTNGYRGKLTGVERATNQIKHLRNTFEDKVYLVQQDILEINPTNFKHDVFLWMWSGIMEFDPEEQAEALEKLYASLNPKGKIYIDLPYQQVHKVGEFTDEDHHRLKFETEWGTLEAYLIDEFEMEAHAKNIGADVFEKKLYTTDKGFERVIYVLGKN
jgi:SAM-dependent methyltransferase